MITRYRSKKAMAQVEILKELIKTGLGGKIDTLTKMLDHKNSQIIELENKLNLLEDKINLLCWKTK